MGGPELEIPARAFAVRRRGKLGGKRLAQRLDRHAHGNLDLRAERAAGEQHAAENEDTEQVYAHYPSFSHRVMNLPSARLRRCDHR